MGADEKIAQDMLSIRDVFFAELASSFLLFTTSRTDNHAPFTCRVFLPGGSSFEKRPLVRGRHLNPGIVKKTVEIPKG
jgi:hypothetical protein